MKRIFLVSLLVNFYACSNAPSKTGLAERSLPSMSVLLTDSITRVEIDHLPKQKPVILFYFRPDCPYCQAQTEALVTGMRSLAEVQICMIANASIHDIRNFYNQYKLNAFKNITVGLDELDFFGKEVKPVAVPFLVIYDARNKLKKIVIGGIQPEKIREIINH